MTAVFVSVFFALELGSCVDVISKKDGGKEKKRYTIYSRDSSKQDYAH